MSTISGSISRNTSRSMSFYLTVTVTNEPANYRFKVKVDAIMDIGTWGWDSITEADSITITIGGSANKKTFNGMNCASHYSKYTMHTSTRYFPYSTSNQAISISAVSTDIAASGYGPGVCRASGSISIGSVYSSSGVASVENITEDVITVAVSGLPTASYPRTIKYWNKEASEASWSLHTQETIDANTAPGTRSKNISSLLPATTYNFDAIVYAGNGDVISHKYVNGTTAEASGELVLSDVDYGGMTATVVGMKSRSGYDREIKFFYKRSVDSTWTLASTKIIPALTVADTPAYVFAGLVPGAKYDVKADFVAKSRVYKTTNTASCSLPFDGVSVPEVMALTQSSPHSTISIAWRLKTVEMDSLDSTVFNVYLRRASGSEILVQSINGDDLTEPYEATTTYDAGNWLLENERVTAYVKAANAYSAGQTESNEVSLDVTRFFYWDDIKEQGKIFGISASEWNRLRRFVNDAASMYPEYFIPITSAEVDAGDIFTAVLANAAAYGSDVTVSQFDSVLASDAMHVQSFLNARMKEATGL